jgi:hypothetical protein
MQEEGNYINITNYLISLPAKRNPDRPESANERGNTVVILAYLVSSADSGLSDFSLRREGCQYRYIVATVAPNHFEI